MARDEFSKLTIEILAKRVAYNCSNPSCQRSTVGPNSIGDKATSIGEAAHITAASPGGPRHDPKLLPDQRKYIDNAIWLCSNCATLIDKDEILYTVDLLKSWKGHAEEDARMRLSATPLKFINVKPHIDIDLLPSNRGRIPNGYSDKNPTEIHNGKTVMVLPDRPIIFWSMFWNYRFVIYNNSQYPAYNFKIESIGDINFNQFDILPKVNNIRPLDNISLKVRLEDFIEGTSLDADKIQKQHFPRRMKDIKLRISYDDDRRAKHTNEIEFIGSEISIVN